MPPVPKVIFAMPGVHAALADEAGLLVAGERRDRRRSRRARVAAPRTPLRVDDCGQHRRSGCAARRAPCRPSRWRRRVSSPVTAAFDASVTWTAAFGEVPGDPACRRCRRTGRGCGRDRRGRGGARTFVADALGATWMPSACSTRQSPTVRRSCQPMPGPTGSPVARSHTIVEARWLAMPTASTGPASASTARASSSAVRAIERRRTRRGPAPGEEGRSGRCCSAAIVASGRTTAARRPLVPTSMTRMLMDASYQPVSSPTGRRATAGRACPG